HRHLPCVARRMNGTVEPLLVDLVEHVKVVRRASRNLQAQNARPASHNGHLAWRERRNQTEKVTREALPRRGAGADWLVEDEVHGVAGLGDGIDADRTNAARRDDESVVKLAGAIERNAPLRPEI